MIRVLIADDHTIVREGLKQIFMETDDILASGEAGNGQEVIKKIEKDSYDVVLLDILLPGKSGLDVLKDIRSISPAQRVLMLSMYPEEQYAIRSLRAGAAGYLTKESATSELIHAIRRVAAGRKYITPSLAERIAVEMEFENVGPLHESLSDREYQVLCMIASGKTVKCIADDLSLSVKTISTYRSRVLEKMGMKNNADLTRYAIKNKLVD